ncbi:MAG: hypothetical protein Q8O25_14915 [Sulfurisoma sp.]|nr:hypothetical protein [Sulfurisoma sp.]
MKPAETTLMDILDPPRNPWLGRLLSGKGKPPAGVRVIRFDEPDDFAAPDGLGEAKAKLRDFAEA